MTDIIKPSVAALREALTLSESILQGIELSQLPLTNSALKSSRLARLLNDFQHQKIFEYEAGGYPNTPNGLSADVWACADVAGRVYQKKDDKEVLRLYATIESIEQLEAQIEGTKLGIDAARDPDVSVSSANPHQYVSASAGNTLERRRLHAELKEAVRKLGARRSFIYRYVVQRNLELKFSAIAGDAFSRIREHVDSSIGAMVPSAVQKFSAIYDNLNSENPEDWSNAVHGCRRVLQDLADAMFPPTDSSRERQTSGKTAQIKLGADNYINRLICFVEDRTQSERTVAIVGSQLSFLGDRLDALFKAAQKGSHSTISAQDEADRYVVYTYMVVGDLLQLNATANAA